MKLKKNIYNISIIIHYSQYEVEGPKGVEAFNILGVNIQETWEISMFFIFVCICIYGSTCFNQKDLFAGFKGNNLRKVQAAIGILILVILIYIYIVENNAEDVVIIATPLLIFGIY